MQTATLFPFEARPTSVGAAPWRRRDDAQARALFDGYATRGGLVSGDSLLQAMRGSWRQPISVLARWIALRKVLSFTWRGEILLPSFQFEPPRHVPLDGVTEAVAELVDAFDDPGLAAWFIQPHTWLGDAVPADLVRTDPQAVLGAARFERSMSEAARRIA